MTNKRVLVTAATGKIGPWMFMKAVRVNAQRLGFDRFTQSGLRHYLPESAVGTWEVGGPTTHVRDVAGVEPEDFLTIARRYVTPADNHRTAGNFIRQVWNFMLTGLVPMHRLDRFDRLQQHPQPTHPRLSGQSTVWRSEHPAPAHRTNDPFGAITAELASAHPENP
jgi:NAD(P)H dehydrogenase (quinone)